MATGQAHKTVITYLMRERDDLYNVKIGCCSSVYNLGRRLDNLQTGNRKELLFDTILCKTGEVFTNAREAFPDALVLIHEEAGYDLEQSLLTALDECRSVYSDEWVEGITPTDILELVYTGRLPQRRES